MSWFTIVKQVEQVGDSIPSEQWEKMNIVDQKSHNMVMTSGAAAKIMHASGTPFINYTKQIDGVTLKVTQGMNYLKYPDIMGEIRLLYEGKKLGICIECQDNMGTAGDKIASMFMIGRQLGIIDIGIKLIKKYNFVARQKLLYDKGEYGFHHSMGRFINENRELLDEDIVEMYRNRHSMTDIMALVIRDL